MSTQHKGLTWAGWILTVLVGLLLLAVSAPGKFTLPPEVKSTFIDKFGYTEDLALAIGITEVCCTVLFLIPRTAVLGAVLLTGYLGGAVNTHVRFEHDLSFIFPVIAGVLVWLALYLRDPRIRALLPWRQPHQPPS